jgi:brefeldin A-inhibited guanine nucleotide-exchange protein
MLQVPADRCLPDPPLLRLEAEASQAYLSTLLHITAAAPEPTRQACSVEARLVQLCMRNLERFEGQEMAAEGSEAASKC